jgi:uncharacterized protein YbjT (DUF2867 family)
VAHRLAELATGPAQGRVPDMGGPEILAMTDLSRECIVAKGRRRLVVPVPIPGRVGRAFRAGHNLTPEHADGRRTFAAFLADQ